MPRPEGEWSQSEIRHSFGRRAGCGEPPGMRHTVDVEQHAGQQRWRWSSMGQDQARTGADLRSYRVKVQTSHGESGLAAHAPKVIYLRDLTGLRGVRSPPCHRHDARLQDLQAVEETREPLWRAVDARVFAALVPLTHHLVHRLGMDDVGVVA